ncbi:MAG: peptidoglycan DD-metalloendopeptidase family protein, partial [Anaerolineales bacterium]|nr:peptidoglycan DD-metalloendopeptidase family protein [Anaerolineales bacterium]
MLGTVACANATNIPKSAMVASEMSLQPAVAEAVSASPTAPLPPIPVEEVTNAERAYPPPVVVETAGDVGNPYPIASSATNSVLPAPVIVNNEGPPPTPTTIATVAVPTVTPVPTEPTGPTATAQPTYTPPALPATSGDEHYWLRRPVEEGGIVWTDKFYPYGSTRGGTLRPHHGVEFNVPYNTPIIATAAGTVVFAGADNQELLGPHLDFYGNAVVIEHEPRFQGQPVYTLYGHLNEVYVT